MSLLKKNTLLGPGQTKPMDRIHLDFFGPFYGKTYLIMVGSFSKWCEVEVMRNIDTQNTINTWRSWFSKYGLPNESVTDSGTFQIFCKNNEIQHNTNPPYHQSSNGQAERFVYIYIY